ncbi:MAG: helix-turn-helix domain-containing protein [Pseudomonadota bacterium]
MARAKQDRLISVREAAAVLGCGTSSVWRHAADGKIPQPIRIGGLTRWSEAELSNFIEHAKQAREAA